MSDSRKISGASASKSELEWSAIPDPRVSYGWRTWRKHHANAARQSLRQLVQAGPASLLTVAVVAIALALPTGLYVALQNVRLVTSHWHQDTRISLFLHKTVSNSKAIELASTLNRDPMIARAEYVSPEQGLLTFQSLLGLSDTLVELPENPLPGVVVVLPAFRGVDVERIDGLLRRLKQRPEVAVAQLDLQWVRRLNAIMGLGERVLGLIAGLFAVAVCLVVANTVRSLIQSRSDEIEIMKLMGATDAYVSRPFLYTGVCLGLAGGLCAIVIVSLAVYSLQNATLGVASAYGSEFRLLALSMGKVRLLLLISVLLTLGSAKLSVSRYLRQL